MNRASIAPPTAGTNVASGADRTSIDLRLDLVGDGQLLTHRTTVNNNLLDQAPHVNACAPFPASGAVKKSSSSSSTLFTSPMRSSDHEETSSSETVQVPELPNQESGGITATATETETDTSGDSQAKLQEQLAKNNKLQDKALNLNLADDDCATTTIDHTETTGKLQVHPPPRPKSSSDRYAAKHGRDMHQLAIAFDILRELDHDADSDDDVEDDIEEFHISAKNVYQCMYGRSQK